MLPNIEYWESFVSVSRRMRAEYLSIKKKIKNFNVPKHRILREFCQRLAPHWESFVSVSRRNKNEKKKEKKSSGGKKKEKKTLVREFCQRLAPHW
jgi:hypothetical protein